MKKKLLLGILVGLCFILTGCGKYKGYWCNYEDTATIVVLYNDDITDEQKKKIEATIDDFENIRNRTEYTKDDYAAQIGGDVSDLHNAYVVTFSSHDFIGDYVATLKKLDGVYNTEQEIAKTNISLYNLQSFGKYTFSDSDEAKEEDLETGKYKIKKGVITFKPKDSDKTTKLLYVKNGLLCGDADCTKIFAKSDSKCGSKE
ncbi:MAG: hypothetical protein IKH54_02995 [Bacilli bacterium]|nr:hypothetical protein [Bacilli bacterium]